MDSNNSNNDIRDFLNEIEKGEKSFSSPVNDNSLNTIWELSKESLEAPEFDSESAWRKFISDREISGNQGWKKAALWVAVILAILLSAYYIITEYPSSPQVELPAIAEQFEIRERLPDGSIIALDNKDEIAVDQEFSNNNRKIILSGNAYCSIETDPANPFEIMTNNGWIKVLGTSFFIEQSKGQLQVAVIEGKVELTHPSIQTLNCQVTKGETATVFSTQKAILIERKNMDTHTLIMAETTIGEAVAIISTNTGINLALAADETGDTCRITSRWNLEDTDSWTEELKLLFNARIDSQKDTIKISGLRNYN